MALWRQGDVKAPDLSKSVHKRFVHSVFQTRGDYTPTRALQCANVVWSDLGTQSTYQTRVQRADNANSRTGS
jgi:hypothetical protein